MTLCSRQSNFCRLNNLMRMLWEQHAVWTRAVIVSIVDGLPDEEFVTRRLLRNPADLANALQPFYGKEVAGRFNDLITEHLVIAAELVKAAKAGDSTSVAEIEKRWYANAEAIAAFMSAINPFWSHEALSQMWRQHLALVGAQAVNRLNKNYAAEIAAYDQGEILILGMADEITDGIVQQFPCLFRTHF